MTFNLLPSGSAVRRNDVCPHAAAADALPVGDPRSMRPVRTDDRLPGMQHRAPADRGPISRARRSLVRVVALPPEQVPSRTAVQAIFDPATLASFGTAFACSRSLTTCRRRLADALPKAGSRRWPTATELVRRGNTLDSDIHDAFFGIFRSGEAPEIRHIATILNAAAILRADLIDAETDLDTEVVGQVARGIELSFAIATGVTPAALALPPLRTGSVDDGDRAARRWLRGHHIFLTITHALIAALEDVVDALALPDPDPAPRVAAMATFAALLDTSANAIRLTGDFQPAIYDGVIRVAMSPPFMPEGFSGVFSSDHRHLARRLREVRPIFEAIRHDMPGPHAEAVASMTRLYDHHKQVCARFVGVDRSSLLMNADANETAMDQLEKFKHSRLRSLGVQRPRR